MNGLSAVRALRSSEEYERVREVVDRRAREPNIFRAVPGLTRVEGAHSDLLAWLANPEQWHGLADGFARELLGVCITKVRGVRPVHWPPKKTLEIVSVAREVATTAGPIDVLVRARIDGRLLVLGVENKIDSPEAPGQLDRYAEGLANHFPDAIVIVTLLAPDEMSPTRRPRIPWSSLSYALIIQAMERALASRVPAPVIDQNTNLGEAIVNQYLSVLRSDVMKVDEELEQLCRELYREHRLAWRAIRTRLPSERDELHASLAKSACGVLSQRLPGDWHFSIRRNRYAVVYRSEWVKWFGLNGKSRREFVDGLGGELSSPAVAIIVTAREREEEETGGAPARVLVEVKLRVWDGPTTRVSTERLLKALKAKGRQNTRTLKTRLAKSALTAVATAVDLLSDNRVLNDLKLVRR
jgi:hypothetical protein